MSEVKYYRRKPGRAAHLNEDCIFLECRDGKTHRITRAGKRAHATSVYSPSALAYIARTDSNWEELTEAQAREIYEQAIQAATGEESYG